MNIATRMLFAVALVASSSTTGFAAEFFVYIGSYTIEPSSGRPPRQAPAPQPGAAARPAAEPSTSKGIYAWRFDEASDKLTELGLVAESANPAHLWTSPNGKYVYAVNWQENDARVPPGISAYAVNPTTGALTLLNKQVSGGELPNEVILDPSGKVAATVNYKTGSMALLPVNGDGSLGVPFAVEQNSGAPQNPKGDGPHAHGLAFSKDSKWLFEAELGLDRVYSYRIDVNARKLTPINPPYVTTPAGSGPRRMQLGHDDRFLYVNRQNDGKVSVYSVNDGKLTLVQEIGTNADPTARSGTTESQIDHAGRFLYVAAGSAIAAFSIDQVSGKLTLVETIPALGARSRNMTVSPSGDLLFVANQTSGNVVIFKMNHSTGHLDPLPGQMHVSQAAGVTLVKVGN